MLNKRRNSDNYGQFQPGQTLFDFLKRKKKFALEASLSKSKHKQNSNLKSNTIIKTKQKQQASPHKRYEQTYRQSTVDPIYADKSNLQTARGSLSRVGNSTTPRKVTFADETPYEDKKTNRSSFIEIISPIKRGFSSRIGTPDAYATSRQISKSKEYSRSKPSQQQTFHRRNLNNSINSLKSTILNITSCAANLKQKSHSLFVQLRPLIKQIEQTASSALSKKASQLKLKLRSFEHLFSELTIYRPDQLIEQFHRNLSQHLMSVESSIRASFQKQHISTFTKIRDDRDGQVEDLSGRCEALGRELEAAGRKYSRLQGQFQDYKVSAEEMLARREQQSLEKMEQLRKTIAEYHCQVQNLSEEVRVCRENEKELQKAVKDWKYSKQEVEKRLLQQNSRVKSTKQQYLLNQISMLRKQFQADMQQLTAIYSTKQQQHLQIIAELNRQIKQLMQQRDCDKLVEAKVLADCVGAKSQKQKFRKQNECLLADLHRMNEELYQHWMALKDVRTLALRLQVYGKFGKIYDDLGFNDQLFV